MRGRESEREREKEREKGEGETADDEPIGRPEGQRRKAEGRLGRWRGGELESERVREGEGEGRREKGEGETADDEPIGRPEGQRRKAEGEEKVWVKSNNIVFKNTRGCCFVNSNLCR